MDILNNSGQPPAEIPEFDEQTAFFFRILYGTVPSSGVLNVCTKKSGGGIKTHSFQSNDIDGIVTKIMAVRDHSDVYFETCLQSNPPVPGKRGDAKSKTVMIGIWFDVDVVGLGHASTEYPKTNEEAMQFAMELQPSLIVGTGGGIHLYWLFDEPWVFQVESDRQRAQATVQFAQRHIIEKGKERGWKFDNTSDLARLMRVPGTYNHKNGGNREVGIIFHNPEIRYKRDDFMPPPPEEPPEYPVVRHMASPPTDVQYPPSNADNIITYCAVIRHCVEDADSLTEPEWFIFLSIISHAEDGDRLCHQYSSPYPGYSFSETDKKIAHAVTVPPITCEKIQMNSLAEPYCSHCPFRKIIKSPIRLGDSNQRVQLMIKGVAILNGTMNDPGLPFEKESMQVLAILRREQPETYSRIRAGFAKMNISVSSMEARIQNMVENDSPPYLIENGVMICIKHTAWGEKRVQLCNFTATIAEQIIKDDGISKKIHYLIKGVLSGGTPLPDVIVPAESFGGMSWVAENYGARAIVTAGQGAQDHIRAAIQFLSHDISDRSIYTHTGWRKIDGDWYYLTTRGALGANGMDESVEVELEGKLKNYSLPNLSHDYSIQNAVLASIKILEVASQRTTIPILCAIYRAPLEEALPNDFTIFFAGQTGTQKSEMTALMLAHFGAEFNGKNLTAEWISSPNSLEKMASKAKDAVFAIDDFFPGTSQIEANKMHATADRIIRGQGNKSGRARMNADGSLRETFVSRGLIVASGEDIPRGVSLRARMYLIELTKGEVNLNVLSQLQKMAADGVFVSAMAGYIKWLAPQMDDLKLKAPQRKAELRDEVINTANAHSRTPEIVAGLIYGLEQFLEYAVHVDAYNAEQAQDLRKTAISTLIESNSMLQEVLESDDPVKRFNDLLLSAFSTGVAHLEGLSGGIPAKDAIRWGWKKISGPSGDETKPGGKLIGWVDGINLYIDPEAVFASVQEIASRGGGPITVTQITLRKRLSERGILVRDQKTGKLTTTIATNGGKRKVIHLLVTKLFEDEAENAVKIQPNNLFVKLLGTPKPVAVDADQPFDPFAEDDPFGE